jgi:hypothetical protein
MAADIEAEVLVLDGPGESTYLRITFQDAGAIASAGQEISGCESGRTSARDENAVA